MFHVFTNSKIQSNSRKEFWLRALVLGSARPTEYKRDAVALTAIYVGTAAFLGYQVYKHKQLSKWPLDAGEHVDRLQDLADLADQYFHPTSQEHYDLLMDHPGFDPDPDEWDAIVSATHDTEKNPKQDRLDWSARYETHIWPKNASHGPSCEGCEAAERMRLALGIRLTTNRNIEPDF